MESISEIFYFQNAFLLMKVLTSITHFNFTEKKKKYEYLCSILLINYSKN